MDTSKNLIMAPTSNPEFDINTLIKVLIAVSGSLIGILVWMKSYFKDKALERDAIASAKKIETEEFIEKVAVACVKATLASVLGDVKEDIKILFKYRDEDKKHWDDRFDKVMNGIKK